MPPNGRDTARRLSDAVGAVFMPGRAEGEYRVAGARPERRPIKWPATAPGPNSDSESQAMPG